jgi:hypothetical protein
MVPFELSVPCNWLQIAENSIDPMHAVFLHARATGPQFHDTWGELPVLKFHERSIGFCHSNARRVGDNVWIRFHDLILPNMTQNGSVASMDGRTSRYFGRVGFTRWQMPVDNTHTRLLGWRHFHDRGDHTSDELKKKDVMERQEIGELHDRPFEERQRRPGDYEIFTGLGPITIHKKEHLASSDVGVVMLRRRLRREIRALAEGRKPIQPSDIAEPPISTYAGDTVLRLPIDPKRDDVSFRRDLSEKVYEVYLQGESLKGEARCAEIERRLKALA